MKTLFRPFAAILTLLAANGIAAAAAPSDANIAAIAVTANQVDVDFANVALGKTADPEVKKFAQLMVTDHTSVIKQATDLAGKLKLTPVDDDTSKGLKKSGDDTMTKLKGLSGAEFDKAYVANEVGYHKAVIDAVDKVLIPNAKNAELLGLLKAVRPVLATHLAHAEQLSKTLGAH